MQITFGRKNLALTIFVPWDCGNQCEFCTSKESYERKSASYNNVAFQMKKIFEEGKYPIEDVVFTGGEPMANIKALEELIALVPEGYKVYINTTFRRTGAEKFIDLVNGNVKIKGVNISRHGETWTKDAKGLRDIAGDDDLQNIKKSVRINCVWMGQDLDALLKRWEGTGVELSIRKDYTERMDQKALHSPYDEVPMMLIERGFEFEGSTACNVCHTMKFSRDGFYVRWHKGLQKTAIEVGGGLEINDLIIEQDGFFTYDWGENDLSIIAEMEKQFGKTDKRYWTGPTAEDVYDYLARSFQSVSRCNSRCGGKGGCGGGC